MVIQKSQQIHGIGINQILCLIIIKFIQSASPFAGLFVKCLIHQSLQRKIHDCWQIRVQRSSQPTVFLPIRNQHITVQPGFSYNIEIRIFIQHLFTPLTHKIKIRIWMRVLSDTVDSRILNPPDTALYQVTGHMTVPLVKIGHHRCEPAVRSYFLFVCAGMNIHHTGGFK